MNHDLRASVVNIWRHFLYTFHVHLGENAVGMHLSRCSRTASSLSSPREGKSKSVGKRGRIESLT